MRRGIFVQARIGSARLPGKALLPLGGEPVLARIMAALSTVPAETHAILCDDYSERFFSPLVSSFGFELVVGDEHDVLDRYCRAIEHFGVETVVRATGDNPFVSPAATRAIMGEFDQRGVDYARYDAIPLGTGVEVVKAAALVEANASSTDPYDHEHVTPFIYRNPDKFSVAVVQPPDEWKSDRRVTLDTEDDYRRLCTLFARTYRNRPVEIEELGVE